MSKLDLKKSRKALFRAPLGVFEEIEVPPASYLMADGHGDPNTSPNYALAIQGLYAIAYQLKFACKADGRDFVVAPLEGLWSAEDPESFVAGRKDEWDWTMMIMMPDYISAEMVEEAKARSRAKLGHRPESLRLDILSEGLCLQTLHVGSYEAEGPLLAKLHREVMPGRGFLFAGRHHEVYLNDPRRTSPEKLRTIVRQPVRRASA